MNDAVDAPVPLYPSTSAGVRPKKRKRSADNVGYSHSHQSRVFTGKHSQLHLRQNQGKSYAHSSPAVRASAAWDSPTKRGTNPSTQARARRDTDCAQASLQDTGQSIASNVVSERARDSPSSITLLSPEAVEEFLNSLRFPEQDIPFHEDRTKELARVSPSQSPLLPPFSPARSPLEAAESSLRTNNNDSTSATADIHSPKLNIIYKGHRLPFNLASLPDDSSVTIALLTETHSDAGVYLLISAHYRRTERPRAARSVLHALLTKSRRTPSDNERFASERLHPELSCALADLNESAVGLATLRPALLMLAACELDISRGNPGSPTSQTHAAAAHKLFHAIYGRVSDCADPSSRLCQCNFTDEHGPCLLSPTARVPPLAPPESNSMGREKTVLVTETHLAALERIRTLEQELQQTWGLQKKLQEDCTAARNSRQSMKAELNHLKTRYEALNLLVVAQGKMANSAVECSQCSVGTP